MSIYFIYIAYIYMMACRFVKDFTAADVIMSFPIEGTKERMGLDKYPHLQKYLDTIHERPAYKRAEEKGGKLSMVSWSVYQGFVCPHASVSEFQIRILLKYLNVNFLYNQLHSLSLLASHLPKLGSVAAFTLASYAWVYECYSVLPLS